MWWQLIAPSRILLDLGPIKIYWYGLFVVIGIVASLAVVLKEVVSKKLDLDKVYDLFFYLIIGGFLGARLWEVVVYNWSYFKLNPLAILKIWQGGLAIQGGLLGGGLVLLVWCWRNRQSAWQYLDLVALGLPLGQAIGRLGNYFNQELFGWPTQRWFGIYIEAINRPLQFINSNLFQPVFLYESLLNLLLFFWLYFQRKKDQAGLLIGWYLIGYGLIRFCLEFIRIDVVGGLSSLRWPQIIALLMVGGGIWILLSKTKKSVTISQLS